MNFVYLHHSILLARMYNVNKRNSAEHILCLAAHIAKHSLIASGYMFAQTRS